RNAASRRSDGKSGFRSTSEAAHAAKRSVRASARDLRGPAGSFRDNALDRHHAEVLMSEDVAMEDEIADVLSAEIHEHLDVRVRNDGFAVATNASGRVVAAVRRRRTTAVHILDHVEPLAVDARCLLAAVGFKVVLRQHQEMDLVLVEFVVLLSVVLDD